MSNDPRPFSAIASVFLALVALGHLLRAVLGLALVVGDYAVPPSLSVVAAVVTGVLSLMVWRESRG